MRFLITGVNGQLGYDVKRELISRKYNDILALTREKLDLTNETLVLEVINNYKPDIIIHCAAYTAVDKAEDEKDLAYDVNVNATKYIVKAAGNVGAKLIYISTDYVFDGTKEGLYKEDDIISPINYYGKTKYLGEEEVRKYSNHIIARISWVFGINGKNFVKTMLKLAEIRDEISVVSDQIGSPTYTVDLSKVLVDISLSEKVGTYHITNSDYCSWYEFAKYIFEVNNINIVVNPIKTSDYKTIAKRPINSRLDKSKLESDSFELLPSWKDAIKRYSVELEKEGRK